jgi:hypothetical protein
LESGALSGRKTSFKEHDMKKVRNPRAAAPVVFILAFFLLGITAASAGLPG